MGCFFFPKNVLRLSRIDKHKFLLSFVCWPLIGIVGSLSLALVGFITESDQVKPFVVFFSCCNLKEGFLCVVFASNDLKTYRKKKNLCSTIWTHCMGRHSEMHAIHKFRKQSEFSVAGIFKRFGTRKGVVCSSAHTTNHLRNR